MATKEKGWTDAKGGKFNDMVNVKEKVGKVTTGLYKGSRSIDRDGDISIVHTLVVDDKNLDFWGTGALNKKLSEVPVDAEIRIEYLGMVEGRVKIKGKMVKKDIHSFDVKFR